MKIAVAAVFALLSVAAAGCQDQAAVPSPPTGAPPSAGPPGPVIPDPATPAPVAGFRLAFDGDGLRLVDAATGSTRPLPFGTAQAGVLAALEPTRGAAGQGRNADCGADYANWADGLGLTFRNGRFAGWSLDGRAKGAGLTTMAGVGPGSTRAELDAAHATTVSQTTLGTEFTGGGFSGLLSGPGPGDTVTDMWAGSVCLAR